MVRESDLRPAFLENRYLFRGRNSADRLEGVIVSVVLDGQRGRSFLLVLDAQSFEEVGRGFAPQRSAVLSGGLTD
jgi:carotenoid cleavage dioxygenase-like enzyme